MISLKFGFIGTGGIASSKVRGSCSSPEFSGTILSYYFNSQSDRSFISFIPQGSTRYNLSKKAFMVSQVNIPVALNEQEVVANTLFSMDKEIEALEIERDKMIQISKEGTMDDLLTGYVRLSLQGGISNG